MKKKNQELNQNLLGAVVISKAGRDAGYSFIITEVLSTDYVALADGKYHLLAKPKRKKLKHVALTGVCCESIGEKLKENKKVFDSEVFSAIKKAAEAAQKD